MPENPLHHHRETPSAFLPPNFPETHAPTITASKTSSDIITLYSYSAELCWRRSWAVIKLLVEGATGAGTWRGYRLNGGSGNVEWSGGGFRCRFFIVTMIRIGGNSSDADDFGTVGAGGKSASWRIDWIRKRDGRLDLFLN